MFYSKTLPDTCTLTGLYRRPVCSGWQARALLKGGGEKHLSLPAVTWRLEKWGWESGPVTFWWQACLSQSWETWIGDLSKSDVIRDNEAWKAPYHVYLPQVRHLGFHTGVRIPLRGPEELFSSLRAQRGFLWWENMKTLDELMFMSDLQLDRPYLNFTVCYINSKGFHLARHK